MYKVTMDKIIVRNSVTPELHYPSRPAKAYGTAERAEPINMSDFPNSGKWEGFTPPPIPE